MSVRQIDVSKKVKSGEIVTRIIRTADLLFDGLTKPLQGALSHQSKKKCLCKRQSEERRCALRKNLKIHCFLWD